MERDKRFTLDLVNEGENISYNNDNNTYNDKLS